MDSARGLLVDVNTSAKRSRRRIGKELPGRAPRGFLSDRGGLGDVSVAI